jgi:hypothetical protein
VIVRVSWLNASEAKSMKEKLRKLARDKKVQGFFICKSLVEVKKNYNDLAK